MKKNLIYQVWAGDMRPGCKYSEKLFRNYAKSINADYRLDLSPNIASKHVSGKDGMYFEWLNPMIDDSFLEYDKVCVVDLDVFPVNNLTNNINTTNNNLAILVNSQIIKNINPFGKENYEYILDNEDLCLKILKKMDYGINSLFFAIYNEVDLFWTEINYLWSATVIFAESINWFITAFILSKFIKPKHVGIKNITK